MKKTAFRLTILILILSTLVSMSGCGETNESEKIIFAMDTQMTLKAYGDNRDAGLAAAESIILSMDRMLDPELDSSKVYELNHANGEAVVVSSQIAKMVETAQEVYKNSDGALDLTIYPLIKRWHIQDGKGYVPSDVEIAEDLARLCFDKVVLTPFPSSGSYTLQMPSYGEITFASIAKGCASDYAVEAMRNSGVESGIVSLGGNVRTLGVKPNGDKWSVAVQDPNNTSSYIGILEIGETSVVTSGPYQRYFTDMRGKVYHHILKPKTGYPVNNTLSSVTVICEDATLADSLSTALFVLGASGAMNYWRNYGKGVFDLILVTNTTASEDVDGDDGNKAPDKDEEDTVEKVDDSIAGKYRVICTTGLIEDFTLTNTRDYYLSFIE